MRQKPAAVLGVVMIVPDCFVTRDRDFPDGVPPDRVLEWLEDGGR